MPYKLKILFVEDNRELAANLAEFFTDVRYETDFASDGLTALHLLANNNYDIIVLDVMLPGINGLGICKKIRNELGSSVPIILLTALDAIENKMDGFGAGANDYLCKPFDMRELELRINVLCKHQSHQPGLLTAGDVSFNTGSLIAAIAGNNKIALSGLSASLFETLMRAYPNFVDYETISIQLWGTSDVEENTIRTHIYTLRKQLKQSLGRSLIKGIYGRGYQLDPAME
jgi:DNA-binding response OmpR family regulator